MRPNVQIMSWVSGVLIVECDKCNNVLDWAVPWLLPECVRNLPVCIKCWIVIGLVVSGFYVCLRTCMAVLVTGLVVLGFYMNVLALACLCQAWHSYGLGCFRVFTYVLSACVSVPGMTLLWAGLFQGFMRVYDNMPDICLDVPNAYQLLETFINLCRNEGFLSEAFLKDMPQRWVCVLYTLYFVSISTQYWDCYTPL